MRTRRRSRRSCRSCHSPPAIIKLNETRIRLEDVKSQEAAGILTDLTREIAKIKSRVEAGLTGATTPDALKVSKDLATRGADAVDGLRNSVTTWFNFYNRLRSPLHVVDGDAVQAGRHGARRLRRLPARQGRASRPDYDTGDAGRARSDRAGAGNRSTTRSRTCRRSSRCRRTRCARSSQRFIGVGGGRGGARRDQQPRKRAAPRQFYSTGSRR